MARKADTTHGQVEKEIDLSQPTCPNREERANGINVWYGKASQLAHEARTGCLKRRERRFQQSSGCVLNFYLAIRVSTIRDAAVIYHAPVGSSAAALGYREIYRGIPAELGRPANYDLHWMTTNLNENDVVYGATEKLKDTILEAQRRYDPKAIFILTSCTSGVIGEDIEGAVAEIQPRVKATIVPVHCEGSRSRLVRTGYDAFWHGVLKYPGTKAAEETKGPCERGKYALVQPGRTGLDPAPSGETGSPCQLRARVRIGRGLRTTLGSGSHGPPLPDVHRLCLTRA